MSTNSKDDSRILKGKQARGFSTINNNKTHYRPRTTKETTGTCTMNTNNMIELQGKVQESKEIEQIRKTTQTSMIVIALIVVLSILFTRTYFDNITPQKEPNAPGSIEYLNHTEN